MKADFSVHVGLVLHQDSTILKFCSYKTQNNLKLLAMQDLK